MDDLIADFLTETNESLENLDVEIVNLEQNPNDKELLGSIFRLVHTIKGTCGFLGLVRLEKIAHAAENILGKFRDGELEVKPIAVSLIFESLDAIKEIVAQLAATQKEPEGDDQDLIDRLNEIYENGYANVGEHAEHQKEPKQEKTDTADKPTDSKDKPKVEEKSKKTEGQNKKTKTNTSSPSPAKKEKTPTAAPVAQSIRVNVDVLENLMTMVGELVLTRNQILQAFRNEATEDYSASLQRLNHVTSELQENVMKTRMQPIGNAWAKLPRIIRDLAIELDKKIELQMNGADTELDRQVIELIKDPLTHMIRNSGDHGIETPDARIAAGKNPVGTITLNAYHEGGHIIIEIIDDGKGLNTEAIKKKILANNLATEDELDGMSEKQIHQFIFKPGFSTAAAVTNISGRGVGMDVVRTNIEKIGGTVDLVSQEEKGSTFTIKIPLTLAIVSSLIVKCANERFAIPQLSITELVKPKSSDNSQIEYIQNTPVFRLRDHLLPLISLEDILKLKRNEEDKNTYHQNQVILVTHVGSYHFGIIVDHVCDTEEIVVKPTSSILRDIPVYAGNTILGDGSVIMILDPAGIASAAGEISVSDEQKNISNNAFNNTISTDDETAILLFQSQENDTLKGVPLSLIARLEEFEAKDIELSNDRYIIQYRGHIIPLIPMNKDFRPDSAETHPILVFSEGDKTVGIIIHQILDIVQAKINIEIQDEREEFIGNCIINGKTVDFVNTNYYLTKAYPNWFGGEEENSGANENAKFHILFIDDSDFFRNILGPEMVAGGYRVTTVNNAAKALELCESGEEFDLILTDIEMPEINGIELARKIRKIDGYKTKPIIALSGFVKPEYLEEGRDVGFADYISKNDREALIDSIALALSIPKAA